MAPIKQPTNCIHSFLYSFVTFAVAFIHIYSFINLDPVKISDCLFSFGGGLSCFIWEEDTYGEVPTLRAILVLHQDAVFAGVSRVDLGDGEAGELARLELEDVVVVRHHLAVVLQPGDLWDGVTGDVAGQVQGLRGREEGAE